MPKSKKESVTEVELQTFVYPTIGNGISVKAASQKEADEKAAQIAAQLTNDATEKSASE